ncbi:site-specific integrase [Domibacillus robiginosus]|uniref:site-specific integrase n=1 Tax=Domibacillus robiginosus TaxID=1071054 RepID=UPI00067D7B0F|nr:site-specific integrase [Domibacillus robiginosus]
MIKKKSEQEPIEIFNDFQFNVEDISQQANEILAEQREKKLLIKGDLDSDEWRFICDTRYTEVYFNFKDIRKKLTFLKADDELIVLSLKCWIATLLPYRSIESVLKYYKYVELFLSISQIFNEEYLEKTQLYLTHECDDRTRWNLCVPILNFIDFFAEINSGLSYQKMLLDVKESINMEKVSGMVRQLPSPHDVLTFSWVLEDSFKKNNKKNNFYFKYYPIFIWWSLSTLIPMRPSEFCAIKRDTLSEENNRYYIKLPRIKQKNNSHKVQIVDKIAIPQELYAQLQDYILSTDSFGTTETLISYPSIKSKKATKGKIHFENRFRYNNLHFLLEEFYNQVIEKEYEMDYMQRIRLGDTRHFAFLNLMRQGYHPVEIARLGGHTSLQAQYHYQQHTEYWIDVETLQLMHRLNFQKKINKNNDYSTGNHSYHLDDEFIREKVLKSNNEPVKIDVEIGYCTDPNMHCYVSKCYFCDHWRISQEEYLLKRKEIDKELQQSKNEIGQLVKTMSNLYSIILKEAVEIDFAEWHPQINKDLFISKKQLDEKMHKALNFSTNLSIMLKGVE